MSAKLPRVIFCADCDATIPPGEAEWICGRPYCEDCWADHADDDQPETEF